MEIIDKIDVTADPDLDKRGHNAAVVGVKTKQGMTYEETILSPRGRPENPLTREDHIDRFNQCFDFAGMPRENAEKILSMVMQLGTLPDICAPIPLLLCHNPG